MRRWRAPCAHVTAAKHDDWVWHLRRTREQPSAPLTVYNLAAVLPTVYNLAAVLPQQTQVTQHDAVTLGSSWVQVPLEGVREMPRVLAVAAVARLVLAIRATLQLTDLTVRLQPDSLCSRLARHLQDKRSAHYSINTKHNLYKIT